MPKAVKPKAVKKKKAKRKVYFGMEVQDAIVRYNALDVDKDQSKRNKIYGQEIHKAFDKLCENIINTFKFTYFDDPFEDVKAEVVSFLVMNIHALDYKKTADQETGGSVMMVEMIDYFENVIPSLFKKKKDIHVAYSILELMVKREEIENFNKKALYILIREMADKNKA